MTLPSPSAARRRPHQRAAFTLVEIMMAVAVLVIGASAVVSQIGTHHAQRMWSGDVSDARVVLEFISRGLQAMSWDDLNDRTKENAYLYWARIPDADGVDNDTHCLSDAPGTPLVAGSQDPTQRRRLPFNTRLEDLRVYVEYYRAVTAIDTSGTTLADAANGNAPCIGGLLENQLLPGTTTLHTSEIVHTPQFALAGLAAMSNLSGSHVLPTVSADGGAAPVLLPDDETVAAQVGVRIAERDPVAVRVTVTWIDRSNQGRPTRMRLSSLTGKAR